MPSGDPRTNDSTFPDEDLGLSDTIARRTAALNRNTRPRGLKLQQKVGIGLFAVLVIGGIGILLLGSSETTLKGAQPLDFGTTANNAGFTNISIAGRDETLQLAEEPTLIAAPAVTAYDPEDNSADLARLQELTAAQAEAGRIIAELEAQLGSASNAVEDRDTRIAFLENELQQAGQRRTQAQRDADAAQQRLRNEISRLEGQIAIFNAQPGAAASDNEQARQLEEARKRSQQQIESEALIFDNSSEDPPGIQY